MGFGARRKLPRRIAGPHRVRLAGLRAERCAEERNGAPAPLPAVADGRREAQAAALTEGGAGATGWMHRGLSLGGLSAAMGAGSAVIGSAGSCPACGEIGRELPAEVYCSSNVLVPLSGHGEEIHMSGVAGGPGVLGRHGIAQGGPVEQAADDGGGLVGGSRGPGHSTPDPWGAPRQSGKEGSDSEKG